MYRIVNTRSDEKPLLAPGSGFYVSTVTGGAFGGRGLVEKNAFRVNHPDFFVAGFTAHVSMHTLQ